MKQTCDFGSLCCAQFTGIMGKRSARVSSPISETDFTVKTDELSYFFFSLLRSVIGQKYPV